LGRFVLKLPSNEVWNAWTEQMIKLSMSLDHRLIGAWLTSASDCAKVFEKRGGRINFRQPIDQFATAFTIGQREIIASGGYSTSLWRWKSSVTWVYGVGEDSVMAFTDFGIVNLIELIKMYKDNPTLLKRSDGEN
jgi:hypothetical protein